MKYAYLEGKGMEIVCTVTLDKPLFTGLYFTESSVTFSQKRVIRGVEGNWPTFWHRGAAETQDPNPPTQAIEKVVRKE